MPRVSFVALAIATATLAAPVRVSSLPPYRAPTPHQRGAGAQACRTAATAATTRSKSMGISAETTSSCQFDKATNKSTCTNHYSDSVGTKTTTVSVTTFASARRDRRGHGHPATAEVGAHGYYDDGRSWLGDQQPRQHV